MASSWCYYYTSLSISLFTCCIFTFSIYPAISSASTPITVSYTDHCSSTIPQSSPTVLTSEAHQTRFLISYFTGGERLLRSKARIESYIHAGIYIEFGLEPNYYETVTQGIYKVKGFLYIQSPYQYNITARRKYGHGGSLYHRRLGPSIMFLLAGFLSENSRKLCMVGSASWEGEEGKALNLNAALKLNYATENSTIYNGIISGILESTVSSDDQGYFDPIMMFGFPDALNYKYSRVSQEIRNYSNSVPKNQSVRLQPAMLCSVLSGRGTTFKLEYDGMSAFSPRFLSMNLIQCDEMDGKLRFLARLHNTTYADDQDFSPDSSLIGEAMWDDNNHQIFGSACRILKPGRQLGDAVGDCTMRLSLRYPSFLTIKNDATIVGQLWSTKNVDENKYFGKIHLVVHDEGGVVSFPGVRYEYTESDRARKFCHVRDSVPNRKQNTYPDGHSWDMRFDMSLENSKGERVGWGLAAPLSVGEVLYDTLFAASMAPRSAVDFPEDSIPRIKTNIAPINISYKISITPYFQAQFGNFSPWSMNIHENQVRITAEGVYDAETGSLCMVGCRKIQNSTTNHISRDCEILVKFDFAPLNQYGGSHIKGTIESTRSELDPLYFNNLIISSTAYYVEVAEQWIWRIDLEIVMILISNTLSGVFVALQIFHLKRNPNLSSLVSIAMLVILTMGHMIPLLLNFEALFLGSSINKHRLFGGWLEANEVTVRVITMVVLLLQMRLFQLVWTAKQQHKECTGEKKSAFVSLPIYVLGGLITFLVNRIRYNYSHHIQNYYSVWEYFRAYAGLILDGFLFPQVLLNAFRGSTEGVLCRPFYIGTSAIRLAPHAYNQIRARNYPAFDLNGTTTYYYANPGLDFYSTVWDVVIPSGVVALAVVVFLQQRRRSGGVLPRRFR